MLYLLIKISAYFLFYINKYFILLILFHKKIDVIFFSKNSNNVIIKVFLAHILFTSMLIYFKQTYIEN